MYIKLTDSNNRLLEEPTVVVFLSRCLFSINLFDILITLFITQISHLFKTQSRHLVDGGLLF